MSKISGLRFAVLGCLTIAAAATATIRPLAVPQRHVLPIQTFPITIGTWQAINEHPVEKSVQERLPTARILDRTYQNTKTGHVVDVMLVTATAVEDIHKPTSCLPAQGWQLETPEYATWVGQPVTILTAENQANQRIQVAYWLTGYYPPAATQSPLVGRALDLRNRLVGRDKAMSLFVRVIADKRPGETDLADFVQAALPAVRSLTGSFTPSPAADDPTSPAIVGG